MGSFKWVNERFLGTFSRHWWTKQLVNISKTTVLTIQRTLKRNRGAVSWCKPGGRRQKTLTEIVLKPEDRTEMEAAPTAASVPQLVVRSRYLC